MDFTQLPSQVKSSYELSVLPEKAFVGYHAFSEPEKMKKIKDIYQNVVEGSIYKKILNDLPEDSAEMNKTLLAKFLTDAALKIIVMDKLPITIKDEEFYEQLSFADKIELDGKKTSLKTVQKKLQDIVDQFCNVDYLKKSLFDKIRAARTDSPNEVDTNKSNKSKLH